MNVGESGRLLGIGAKVDKLNETLYFSLFLIGKKN
jgi:hypothetical protein